MDQQKMGVFLKKLRNEKGLTQEQFAEKFGITRRTVSRWEVGSNLPDIDILIEMSDFYEVEIKELLNGERKNEQMNNEEKETALMVARYNAKESMCVQLSVYPSIFMVLICGTVFQFHWWETGLICLAVWLVLHTWLKKKGTEIFASL